MAVTQYIGSRYVPIFADPVEWSGAKEYEPLTIVTHEGNSYTSKQFVPVGIDITNGEYWALTGNYNAQVEQYRQEVSEYSDRIESIENVLSEISNPIYYGADPTGETASDDAINACILANKGGAIWFSQGIYLINRPIKTPHPVADRVDIYGNGATLLVNDDLTYTIDVGGVDTQSSGEAGYRRTYIENLNVLANGNDCITGIQVRSYYKDICIHGCNIKDFEIGIALGSGTKTPCDALITDCLIRSDKSDDVNSIGIKITTHNNEISNTRIYGFYNTIVCDGTETIINNVHSLPKGDSFEAGSAFCKILDEYGVILNDCYCDTMTYFINGVNGGRKNIIMSNCEFYSYQTPFECAFIRLDYSGTPVQNPPRVALNNCYFRVPQHPSHANGSRNYGILISGTPNSGVLNRILSNIFVTNMLIHNGSYLYSGDLLTNKRDSDELYSMVINTATEQNVWRPLCIIVSTAVSNRAKVDITFGTSYNSTVGFTINSTGEIVAAKKFGDTFGLLELGYTAGTMSDANLIYTVLYLRNPNGELAGNQLISGSALNGHVMSLVPDSTRVQNYNNYPNIDTSNVTALTFE